MQLTSSSAETATTRRSATEALAARYRHLFVLPRTYILILSGLLVSLALNLVVHGGLPVIAFVASSAVLLLSASALSSALRLSDKSTIATFRRLTAMLFGSQLLWLLFASLGGAFGWAVGSPQALSNGFLFGAFVCAGFEFLVLNGAFSRSVWLSAGLASVHPVGTFLVVGFPSAATPITISALGTGVIAFAVILAFTLLLRRKKTSRGYDALRLFQAFMKTWTSRDAADLERIIDDHAEPTQVNTKVMRFQRDDGGIFIVLPGVHPGPFFPVGSYNLPGVISDEFKGSGTVLTLHRPGGHERNLSTNAQAHSYAASIKKFALETRADIAGTITGPIQAQIGKAAVSSMAFGSDALLTISFAPLGSDDLEPKVEESLSKAGSLVGFDASVVDAHNSIGQERELPDVADPGWESLFRQMKKDEPRPLRVAYAHSSESDFQAGKDVTENGIGMLMLEAGSVKSVLILADANNAVPTLHKESALALESAGYKLIEFCTSDSHDLAARGLTVTRGYKALGEDTPTESIRKLILDLAKLAEPRLAACKYGSGELTSAVRIFGSKALDEFAQITQSSSNFAKRYSRFAILSTAVLFALSLAV